MSTQTTLQSKQIRKARRAHRLRKNRKIKNRISTYTPLSSPPLDYNLILSPSLLAPPQCLLQSLSPSILALPPPVKIRFQYFWKLFRSDSNHFLSLFDYYVSRRYPGCQPEMIYQIVPRDYPTPDVVIHSFLGQPASRALWNPSLPPECKTVFYTGENRTLDPSSNLNLTFDNSYTHGNIRYPHWLWDFSPPFTQLANLRLTDDPHKSGFCCFVYSNNRAKNRNDFCRALSRYQRVDCGGKCLNNMGGPVSDKIAFQKRYKFCIAFENNPREGYVTEKILEAYQSNCIPIYYGSRTITDDFNPETFINAHNFNNTQKLVDYIKRVDTNQDLYRSYLDKPVFSQQWLKRFNDPSQSFFQSVAHQILTLSGT